MNCLQVELKSGELFRGELVHAEDNWNCQLKRVQTTGKVGPRLMCNGLPVGS